MPICRNVCFPYGAACCFYVLSGMDSMDTEIAVPCHTPPSDDAAYWCDIDTLFCNGDMEIHQEIYTY